MATDPLSAAAQLLESRGYAVIEQLEPCGINEADNTVWSHQPHYIEQEFNGDDLAEIFAAAAKRAKEAF
ncbi:hypothetical protein PP613_03795 [Mycobacteroides abscessus]|nr:hypothetical protein [Mycobacteroides abscessus]MDM2408472.1 hypothetical protein [Mycobacteroides abscessus]